MTDMKKPIRFIGVSGPAAAGKDTVANIICALFRAENLVTSEVFRVMTRYLYRLPPAVVPPRNEVFPVATFLREIDPAFSIKVCLEQARVLHIERIVMSGLRSLSEAEAIQERGGIVIGVKANPQIRYARIQARAKDAEVHHSFEQFLAQDELENKGAIEGRGITSILEHADVVIDNSGSPENLEDAIRQQLAPFLSPS